MAGFAPNQFDDTAGSGNGFLMRDVVNTGDTPAQGWHFPPWGYVAGGKYAIGMAGPEQWGLSGLGDGGASIANSPVVADLKQLANDMPAWGWVVLALVLWKRVL